MKSTTPLNNKITAKQIVCVFVLPFLLLTSCQDKIIDFPEEDVELYRRSDAASTLIPLLPYRSWKYRVTEGLPARKPEADHYFIHSLLEDTEIEDLKLLPVREYDGNSGYGKYTYKALCYITSNQVAYFYMDEKLLVGRYLYPDANGNESVTWEFELPTYSPEYAERNFRLSRSDYNMLSEKSGYDTVEIQIQIPPNIFKRYERCKLFEYSVDIGTHTWINQFFFEERVGLVRFRQWLKTPANENPVFMYEQSLIEIIE